MSSPTEEERAILATFQRQVPHYYPFVLCLFRTGMREGEAAALKPEDLDLRSRHIYIQRNFASGMYLEESPKSGKNRMVDIAADLAEQLKAWLAVREAETMASGKAASPWLFPSPEGSLIRSNNFRDRVWRTVLKEAGLRYRKVHATRHTYATRLIMAGANLVYVQRQLGHSSIKITVDLTPIGWSRRTDRPPWK